MDHINLYLDPKLTDPLFIVSWPSMGSISTITASHIKDSLGAMELGHIEPYDFFKPNPVAITDNIISEPEFPQSKLYYHKVPQGKDLIIMINDAQPEAEHYMLSELIMDIATQLRISKLITIAAIPSHIHYTKKPQVYSIASDLQIASELNELRIKPIMDNTLLGMNGVLLGSAKKRNIEGFCLLGEMPVYMTSIANPRASKAVLDILSEIIDIKLDTSNIDTWINELTVEIEKNIDHLVTEYEEESRKLIVYLDKLKEQADEDESDLPTDLQDYDSILKDVDKFLKGQMRQGEDPA